MQLANRVAETTTTDGYANLVLKGPTFGHRSFSDAALDSFPYCIVHQSENQWEIGEGHLTPGGLLARDNILDSSADGMINLLPGTKDVFLPLPVGFGLNTNIAVGSVSYSYINGMLVGTSLCTS